MIKISNDILERVVIVLIALFISLYFINKDEKKHNKNEITINEDAFDIYPLLAWKDTHKKWDGEQGSIVNIRYRVHRNNTKLWIYNSETNELVHEQPFERDPKKDGTPRDFTYVWKLYKTERSRYIKPGTYTIIVGGLYNNDFSRLSTEITI